MSCAGQDYLQPDEIPTCLRPTKLLERLRPALRPGIIQPSAVTINDYKPLEKGVNSGGGSAGSLLRRQSLSNAKNPRKLSSFAKGNDRLL
jgi:hypothetical protein